MLDGKPFLFGVISSPTLAETQSVDLDFYLSEMSVSDGHGGGLTMQRVLSAELERIAFFAHVHPFAEQCPPTESVKARCLDLSMWLDTAAARRRLGHRVAGHLAQRTFFHRLHANAAAAKIFAALPEKSRPARGLVCPQGLASLYVIERLRHIQRVQYITWIMDDHLVRWRDGRWCYPAGAEELFARHLKRARLVFVISPVMADFYRERFGINARVLFGACDLAPMSSLALHHQAGELRLAYFGAVGDWQLDALAVVAQNMAAAGATLDIYNSLPELPDVLRSGSVRLKGRIAPEKILETMQCYDAVVLPASFRPALRHMTELNIATKMSECLASGTVTLAVGPTYAAMIRFLQKRGAGLCVTDPSPAALATAFARLRDNKERARLIEAARELVEQELCTKAMRNEWLRGVAVFNSMKQMPL